MNTHEFLDRHKVERRIGLRFARILRKGIFEDARKCGVSFKLLSDLEKNVDQRYYAVLVTLLATKNFKSDFRQSVATQAREWFGNDEVRKFRFLPLSQKQIAACIPRRMTHKGVAQLELNTPRSKAQQIHLASNYREF